MEAFIAKSTAEKHAGIIMDHFKELSNENGELSTNKMWNLKKKLCNQTTEVPMAMLDKGGNIVSGKNSLKSLYKTTYIERLEHKRIEDGWEDIQRMKEELFEERLKVSAEKKSEDWNLSKE